MSQREVLILLQELGGRANSHQIIEAAKQKFPECSLYAYVGTRLGRLKKWGDIDFDLNTQEWFINE